MYAIQRRYQYRGPKSIVWTSWFTKLTYNKEEDASRALALLKKQKEINKLNAEYRIIEE